MKSNDRSPIRREDTIGSGVVSVDTLWLYIEPTDFKVSDSPSLHVRPSLGKPDRLLWKSSSGKEVRGLSASYLGEGFHVSLQPFAKGSPWSRPPCLVTFSVPKLIYGHNLLSVTQEQLQSALKDMEDTLKSIGITTDIWKATVCRLDLFRDIVLEFPVEYYIPLLASLYVPYLLQGRSYPTSTFRSNKYRSVAFYDKDAETKKNFPHLHRQYETPNLFRYEYRLRKASVIKAQLNKLRGMPPRSRVTAFDLVRDYDRITKYHASEAEKLFGKFKKRGKEINPFRAISQFHTDLDSSLLKDRVQSQQIRSLADEYGKGARRHLSLLQGLEAALNSGFQSDTRYIQLHRELKTRGLLNHSGDYNQRSQKDKLFPLALLPCGIPCGVLLEELVNKFCSPNLALIAGAERKEVPLPANYKVIGEIKPQPLQPVKIVSV